VSLLLCDPSSLLQQCDEIRDRQTNMGLPRRWSPLTLKRKEHLKIWDKLWSCSLSSALNADGTSPLLDLNILLGCAQRPCSTCKCPQMEVSSIFLEENMVCLCP
jgi:hypothetical protein